MIYVVGNFLKSKKLITSIKCHGQSWVDIMYAACFLYDIFYEKGKCSTLFKLREKYENSFPNVTNQIKELLFQTIEARDGAFAPGNTKPNPTTPQEMFAECVFFFENKDNIFTDEV